MRRELALIQRRFVTEIQPISHDDPNNCGVIWTMALLDFESKTNIKLALEICVNEILCYPKIDISKVNTTIESGHIT